jgi:cytosine permease
MGGLGAPLGYYAIFAGQAFLFIYAGLIGHRAYKFGLNFPMMCKCSFGRVGYIIPMAIIAGLVTGWFAFQAWLAADLMVGLYGGESFLAGTGSGVLPGILGTTGLWAGIFAIIFGFIAVYGIRTMAWMGRAAVICVTGLAIWMIYSLSTIVATETGGNAWSAAPTGEPWTFALGVTASIGTFVVSATMTGDFSRWTKSVKQAWGINAVAFPIANHLMLFIGAFYTAIAGQLDFFFGLSMVALGAPIMIIQWVSNGTTCDGCLYNASQGFRNLLLIGKPEKKLSFSWKKVTIIVMICGTAVAASNVLNDIVPWLLLISTVAPLIGGILIGHFWIVARNNTQEEILLAGERKVNWPSIAGILSGTAIAAFMITSVPDLPPILGGLIGGCVVYPAIAYAAGYASKGKLTAKGIGAAERSGT